MPSELQMTVRNTIQFIILSSHVLPSGSSAWGFPADRAAVVVVPRVDVHEARNEGVALAPAVEHHEALVRAPAPVPADLLLKGLEAT